MKNLVLYLASILALTGTGTYAYADMNFNRIASFATPLNMKETEDRNRETSAEIIAATKDGMTLIYTDSPLGAVGRIDITNPKNPKPLGNVALGGEPTSVSVFESTAYIGVNTSESYTKPSGYLLTMNALSGEEKSRCDLGGQPDSVAISDDNSIVAIAIENERDEDLGDGRTGQLPAGYLAILPTNKGCDGLIKVDLTGLAEVSPEDPEPEFVDINKQGEIVVTLQENNHIVIVSAAGEIINHFPAGSVDLTKIDTIDERGKLSFTDSQLNRKREPDAVKWIDDDHFATANEGDMDGGSRSWTIYNKDSSVVYEAGNSFEHAIIQIGHYPDKRSDSKGVEPESIETAIFDGKPYVFVGAERSSAVGVYDVSDLSKPVLKQILPSGVGPEGYVAIPERNLLVSANEVDLIEEGGLRAHVMLYELQNADAYYPQLTSKGASELIGWGAISGMVADKDGIVWAVNDSFYGFQPSIFKIDTKQKPAKIIDVIRIVRANGEPAQKLDLEGITLDGKGGFYVASEGRTERLIPHAIYHVNAKGVIKTNKGEIGIPAELSSVEERFGFEGITKVGDTLWMVVQREWKDDPKNHVKLVSYNTKKKEWGAVHYPKTEPNKGWVGLSEITAHGDYVYIIERDNQIGSNAAIKKIYRVALKDMKPAPLSSKLPVVSKEEVHDLLPDLRSFNGYVQDKVEGLAIMADGTAWVSTDNDGVDDSSGETFFWTIGKVN